jgi:hypothetical protein
MSSDDPLAGKILNEQDPIFIEYCRQCALVYIIKLPSDEVVTILCGRPPQDEPYKAISYVWETAWPPQRVALKCSHCSAVTNVPMRDISKFHALLSCMKGELPVWLDTMSIDQDDEDDKAVQLAVMGDIYKQAQTISVLLPAEDGEAYHGLKKLGIAADAVVKRHTDFGMLNEGAISSTSSGDETIEIVANEFLGNLKEWTEDVGKWTYWMRAWTFQEWAMAREIEIRWETLVKDEGISNVKNVIVMAATIIVHWKKLQAKYSTLYSAETNLLHQVHVRDEYGKYMHLAKAHFPFEDFLVGDDEDSFENMRRQTFLPGISHILRDDTFMSMEGKHDTQAHFRTRVSLALNSMSMTQRKATNPADKVACWASMCNITYAYDKDDSYATALYKVVTVLRERGLPIYNWLVNTDSAEVDVSFLDYAATQRQSNAANGSFYVGTPIFIGRADTVQHIKNSLLHGIAITHLPSNARVELRQVDRVIIKRPVCWSDKSKALSLFRSIVSGKGDGIRLFDVSDIVEKELDNIDPASLARKLLVNVSIGVGDHNSMWYFNTWAIIPTDTPLEHLLVARESLNGTLVLAVYKWDEKDKTAEGLSPSNDATIKISREPAKWAQIVAYLNTSHQDNGTYLIKSNETGVVDVVFRTADTPQPDLFWIPESMEASFGGLDLLAGLSDAVTDMKISLSERKFMLVKTSEQEKEKL